MNKSTIKQIIKYALVTLCCASIIGLAKEVYTLNQEIKNLEVRIITLEVRDDIMFNL